jgi:hypothetical protein
MKARRTYLFGAARDPFKEAEKVSALETARFFSGRKAPADFKAFDRIMRRRGGKPPRKGDEIPS